jgi:hypothetical protein
MKKIIGFLCVIFAVLLAGCPTEVGTENGEDYVDAAVLLNEKAKYNTAVTLSFDENDAITDVTGQFIQLKSGKTANREVAVFAFVISGESFVSAADGRVFFTGVIPDADDDEAYAGNVIALLFQKGSETTALEVLGIVNRKGEEESVERIAAADAADTNVIYGYDVINSNYINESGVKKRNPILDPEKVNAAKKARQEPSTSSYWETENAESVLDLLSELNVSAKVEYKNVLFSGGISAEYASSWNSKETTRYAKARGAHVSIAEYLQGSTPSALKNYLSDDFKADVAEKSARVILNTYGTHLITRCYLGGIAEFNFSYTGSELADEMKMSAALNASYMGVNAELNASDREKVTELKDNSRFTSMSRGGNNTAFTSVDEFMERYPDWVASIQDKPSICRIDLSNFADTIASDLIPIWELVKEINADKADEIQDEYNYMVVTQGGALAQYVPRVQGYITDIDPSQQSDGNLGGIYTDLVKADAYITDDVEILNANGGSGRPSTQIRYKKSTTDSERRNAIAEIRVVYGPDPASAAGYEQGFTACPVSLNSGTNASANVWLLYRKVKPSDTTAIDFIGSYVGPYSAVNSNAGGTQNIQNTLEDIAKWLMQKQPDVITPPSIASGYEYAGNGSSSINLNILADGNAIYLTVHKSPFKW